MKMKEWYDNLHHATQADLIAGATLIGTLAALYIVFAP